jgi:excinuclease ABC subunit A
VLRSDGERAVATWRVPVDDAERYLGVRERLLEEGYRRALIGGEARDLDEVAPSEIITHGGIDVIADRLKVLLIEQQAAHTAVAHG